jgi:exonuclease SbcD
MRLIHTADWHLGRIFHGVHLTEDQAYVLDQLVDLVKESRVDAVLVAGDVYDRAVPPPDAVRLLDDVLTRLAEDCRTPVILIAGNHDSPERLAFGSRLLSQQGLHVVGLPAADPAQIVLRDEHGPVSIYPLPYAEPAVVRERLGIRPAPDGTTTPDERLAANDASTPDGRLAADGTSAQDDAIVNHQSATRALVDRIRAKHSRTTRSLLVGHAFVVGGMESESERPLSVGGAGTVEASLFDGFDLVALGHLHRPQTVGKGRIRYSGSLLKYSFAEADHAKSVALIEMDARGACSTEEIRLSPRRDVRTVEGRLDEILQGPRGSESPDDYLLVRLLDRQPILDAVGKLRAVYPNVLAIERPHLAVVGELRGAEGDHRQRSEEELFEAFFSQVTGEDLTAEERLAYIAVVEELRRRDREAVG